MSDLDRFGGSVETLQRETTFSTESTATTGEGELTTQEADVFPQPEFPTFSPEAENGDGGGDGTSGGGGGGGGGGSECLDCRTTGPGAGGGTGGGFSPEETDSEGRVCTPERSARQALGFITSIGQETPSCTLAWIILGGLGLLTLNLMRGS